MTISFNYFFKANNFPITSQVLNFEYVLSEIVKPNLFLKYDIENASIQPLTINYLYNADFKHQNIINRYINSAFTVFHL